MLFIFYFVLQCKYTTFFLINQIFIVKKAMKNIKKIQISENELNSIIENVVFEMKKKLMIESIVKDAVKILSEDKALDDKNNKRRQDDKDKALEKRNRRNFVLNKLKSGNGIVQADAMRAIWKSKKGTPEDDINRSLFSKMVSGEPDNDGVVRHFDDDEITKLAQYIHDIGS